MTRLTQDREDEIRYWVRNRVHPMRPLAAMEELLSEIDALRAILFDYRARNDRLVELSLKTYQTAKEGAPKDYINPFGLREAATDKDAPVRLVTPRIIE